MIQGSEYTGTVLDATASYHGYRLQILYTLYYVISKTKANDATFQPEGTEDLAIFSGNHKLVEVIQVKAHKELIPIPDKQISCIRTGKAVWNHFKHIENGDTEAVSMFFVD